MRQVVGNTWQAIGAVVLALWAEPARAVDPRPDLWMADGGDVKAVAVDGPTLYLGGAFTSVVPYTGYGAPLDPVSGQVIGRPPVVDLVGISGEANAVVADGSGGYYIGGNFDEVGGLTRNGVAHVDADGLVTGFDANVSGSVYAMCLAGNELILGGSFFFVDGQLRTNLASVDRFTGTVTSWDPNPNSFVTSVAFDGATIYAGGGFTTIGGRAGSHRRVLAGRRNADGVESRCEWAGAGHRVQRDRRRCVRIVHKRGRGPAELPRRRGCGNGRRAPVESRSRRRRRRCPGGRWIRVRRGRIPQHRRGRTNPARRTGCRHRSGAAVRSRRRRHGRLAGHDGNVPLLRRILPQRGRGGAAICRGGGRPDGGRPALGSQSRLRNV